MFFSIFSQNRGGEQTLTTVLLSRDDDALAAPLRPEDAAAFEQAFQEYAPFVWRALRRLGVPEADIEDVCQEVFMVVLRRLGGFEGRSAIRTWIYGICVRRAGEHRRRRLRRREDLVDAPEPVVPEHQLDELQRRRTCALLDAELEKLSDDQRAVFVLYEIEELPMSEVAEAVGCPLQTGYARLYAARGRLAAAVQRAGGERSKP